MTDDEPSFSLEQVLTVQGELRRVLGLGAERFPLPAFIGMLSDEIEKFRASGRSDAEIAAVIRQATGSQIEPDLVTRYYASPEERHGHGTQD